MKKTTIIIIGIAAIIALVLFFVNININAPVPEDAGSDRVSEQAGDKVPHLTFQSVRGEEVNLREDFSGKVLVANSWATWCPFCREELPAFARLQQEFPDRVAVVAIDRRESKEKQLQYTDQIGVTDSLTFVSDPEDGFYRAIGGFSMPETLFVNQNGTIVEHVRGPLTFEEMNERVENILTNQSL